MNLEMLDTAEGAFRAALRVHNANDTPQSWAATLNGLGLTLQTIGRLKGDTRVLWEAVETYSTALQAFSEKHASQNWAATKNNLGGALQILGLLSRAVGLLEQAQDAYRDALRVHTEKDTPQHWASTVVNLGWLDLAFFDLTADPAHLTVAQTHVLAAQAVFEPLGAVGHLQNIDTLLDEIARRST
jgi:tetratricopeptide (TPR) repeat protein